MATDTADSATGTMAALEQRRGERLFSSSFHPGRDLVVRLSKFLTETHERVSFVFREYIPEGPPQVQTFDHRMDDFLSVWPVREVWHDMMSCVASFNVRSSRFLWWETLLFCDCNRAFLWYAREYCSTNSPPTGARRRGLTFIVDMEQNVQLPQPPRFRFNGNMANKFVPLRYVEAQVEEMDCAICMEGFERGGLRYLTLRMPCEHGFHDRCILEWLGHNRVTCPICRREIM